MTASQAYHRFLDIGKKDFAIPFKDLIISRRDSRIWLVLSRTKDELQMAPAYDKKPKQRYLNGFARIVPALRRVKVMPIMLAHDLDVVVSATPTQLPSIDLPCRATRTPDENDPVVNITDNPVRNQLWHARGRRSQCRGLGSNRAIRETSWSLSILLCIPWPLTMSAVVTLEPHYRLARMIAKSMHDANG
jgi:hypothetical protein